MAQTTSGELETGIAERSVPADLEQARTEIGHLREQLVRAESEAARVPELEAQAAHGRDAEAEVAHMRSSLSWRVTKPLRAAKRLLHR
jgi:hypothetical protein